MDISGLDANLFAAYGSAGGHGDHSHAGGIYDHSHDAGNSMVGEDSLFAYIDHDHVTCLNERTAGMAKNPFKPLEDKLTDEPYLESDADEQLLIHVPFTEGVTLKSICFVGHTGGQAPRNVKLWANKEPQAIDFETAEEGTPDQEIRQLHEDTEAEVYYFCRRDKFNTCSSITIFVSENYGADETRINFIGFKGEFGKGKRRAVHAIYEVTPDATDARVNEEAHRMMAGGGTGAGASKTSFSMKKLR